MSLRTVLDLIGLFKQPEGPKGETPEEKKTRILGEYKRLKKALKERQKVVEVSSPPESILFTPSSIIDNPKLYIDPYHLETLIEGITREEMETELKDAGFNDGEIKKLLDKYHLEVGDILLEVYYDAVAELMVQPNPPVTVPEGSSSIVKHFFERETGVRFSSEASLHEYNPKAPAANVSEDMEVSSSVLTEFLSSHSSDGPHVRFNAFLQIETFSALDSPSAVGKGKTPELNEVLLARRIIGRALKAKFADIRKKISIMKQYLYETQKDLARQQDSQPFLIKNFKFYLKQLNLLSQVMSNMLQLTRDSLKLLLSLRMFSLDDSDREIIQRRIEELDDYKEEGHGSASGPFGKALLGASKHFDKTTRRLIDINQDCLDVYTNIRNIYSPQNASQSGQIKREDDIKTLAFELLEQNILLFNFEVEAYELHKKPVYDLLNGLNFFITRLTLPSQADKTLSEKANFDVKIGDKSLTNLGGIDELIRTSKLMETPLPLKQSQLELLKIIDNRKESVKALSTTATESPNPLEINSVTDFLIFMLKITFVIIMLIFNCINILFVVPFNFTGGGIEFSLIRDNDEYFELLRIKQKIYKFLGKIDDVGTITLSAKVAVGDTIEAELRAIQNRRAYKSYISGFQASGGARKKLTKKQRKRSGQTKNKRQKKQRKYSLRKRKSKAKQSRRKRRQYRK